MQNLAGKAVPKKTILLSIFMGMTVRNLIESGLLRNLLDRYRIIVYTPFASREALKARFAGCDVEFREPLISKRRLWLGSLLYRIDFYRFWLQKRPETAAKYIQRDSRDKPFKSSLLQLGGWLSGLPVLNRLYARFCSLVYTNFIPSEALAGVDIVFTASTDVIEDRGIMSEAIRKGIPTITLVHSWDNIAGRGCFAAHPDQLLVWNDWMKAEATRFHAFPAERIQVVGAPQFSMYRGIQPASKADFMQRHGIPLGMKTITYCASARRVFPDEDEFIDWLIDCIHKERFALKNLLLILRLHPSERHQAYRQKYQNMPGVILDVPDSGFSASFTGDVGDQAGIQNFVDLLANTDLLVNLASTTTIDAAIFNCPVLCPAFNFSVKSDAWNSAPNWYRSEHYRALEATQGFSIARSPEEFIEFAGQLLQNRGALGEGRRRIIRDFAPVIDTNTAVFNAVKAWVDQL